MNGHSDLGSWTFDQAAAKRAAKWGGIACWLAATRKMLTAVAFVVTSGKSFGHSIAWLVRASLIPLVIAVAGVGLLRGGDRFSGCVAIVLIILDVAMSDLQPVTPQLVSSIVVTALLLAFIANGVRGAFALRHVDYLHSL